MGIYSSLFSASEDQNDRSKDITWIPLENIAQLTEISTLSFEKPVVLFKHSTRCSVSRMALKEFENDFHLSSKVTPYFLDLLEHRAISNEIATRFGVVHQSPQLILIRDGKAVYDTSHSGIDVAALEKQL